MAMKTFVVFCLVAASLVDADEKYTNKYDNINIQEVLENPRLLKSYSDCLIDLGKCTPEATELKSHMKEALETGCKKCTDVQKSGTETAISYIIKNAPETWKALCEKYDPTGEFRVKYEDIAKEKGIEIPK